MKLQCICAAIICDDGTVVRGHRHIDCMDAISRMGKVWTGRESQQGFIASDNVFVGRHEGYKIQIAAGIPSFSGEYRGERLFSEDLY